MTKTDVQGRVRNPTSHIPGIVVRGLRSPGDRKGRISPGRLFLVVDSAMRSLSVAVRMGNLFPPSSREPVHGFLI